MQPDSCAPAPPAINHVDFMLVAAGGFLATLVMTTAMYVLPLIGWGQVDLPIWIVRVFTSDPVTVGEVGLGLHLFIGLAYAWVFGYQIEPRLALAPWQAGIIFGVGLWGFAQVIAVPALGALAGTLHPSTPQAGLRRGSGSTRRSRAWWPISRTGRRSPSSTASGRLRRTDGRSASGRISRPPRISRKALRPCADSDDALAGRGVPKRTGSGRATTP
jgi:hypothetical protein